MSSQMLLNLEEETWKGRIPIQFSLSATDILSYASFSAHTYYSFASRYKFSYLAVVAADAMELYQQIRLDFDSEIQFHCPRTLQLLNSALPIGVLFDIYHDTPTSTITSKELPYCGHLLPWKVVVQFPLNLRSSIPPSLNLSSSRVESYFFHSFKQAITLIHGSTKYFNDMPIEKQMQLWAAATLGSYESFRSIAATIKPQHVCAVKLLPLRVILKPLISRGGSVSDADSAASGVTVAVLQRPVLCTESRPLPRSWGALPSAQSPAANHDTSTKTPSKPPHTTLSDRSDGDGGGEGGGGGGGGGGEGDEEGWKAPGDREMMDSGGGTRPEKQQSSMETTYDAYAEYHDPFLFCGRCALCQTSDKIFSEKSLRSVLADHYKILEQSNPLDENPSDSSGLHSHPECHKAAAIATTTPTLTISIGGEKKVFRRILCEAQGVPVSLDSPIFQLWTIFSHADLFLYIVVTCEE